jgi:hypothetical protein
MDNCGGLKVPRGINAATALTALGGSLMPLRYSTPFVVLLGRSSTCIGYMRGLATNWLPQVSGCCEGHVRTLIDTS